MLRLENHGKRNDGLITKVTGKLLTVGEETLTLGIEAFEYEVLIPEFTRRQLAGRRGEAISLHTIQYIDGNVSKGGKLTPRLIGFLNEVEREFFELICTVDGLGVKKALRAMVRPVAEFAELIQAKDAKGLDRHCRASGPLRPIASSPNCTARCRSSPCS